MDHVEGIFKGPTDAGIYHQGWLPAGSARAAVVLVHGIGEHCGRYGNVVDRLVSRGFAVYGFDHVGHGRSGGPREYVDRFDDYVATLSAFCAMVRGWQTRSPLFLLAHSMGGLIASLHLMDHQASFAGAVLSAPSLRAGGGISLATIVASRLLSVLAPRLGVLALDVHGLSRDPKVVADYTNDPLVFHGKTPARLAAEVLKAMRGVMAGAVGITLPLLILQGSADRLVDPAGAREFYDRAGSRDKTLRIFEGLCHEILNEPEHARVLDEIEAWLAAHA